MRKSMKAISVVIFVMLSVSFCNGRTSLLSKDSWKSIGSYLRPKYDRKMSMIDQKLSKFTAYEDVKEKVCLENQEPWGFLKHLETEKVFVENDSDILPWNEAEKDADRFAEHHAEMKPFIRCMDQCFDLRAMFARAVQRKLFFLIESLVDASFEANDDVKKLVEPTDLVTAIKNDKKDLTRVLIRFGTVNVKNIAGQTALHHAAYRNNAEVARVLIKKGADKEAKDNNGRTAMHMAALRDNAEVAIILIEKGADKNAKDNNENTALHLAAYRNNAEVLKILIEKGAHKEAKSRGGHTALHYAAYTNSAEASQILIEKGAHKEAKNKYGNTALHIAAFWNSAEVATILIEKGADKEAKNNDGHTALQKAKLEKNEEVATILIEKGADKDAKDKYGRTAIANKIKFTLKKYPPLLIMCFVIFIYMYNYSNVY